MIRIGIIGGSGIGAALGAESGERVTIETPFGAPSGPLTKTRWEGVDLVLLSRHGEGHVFHPTTVPYRANVFALKTLGVTHIIATGACGSLREEIRPRDLVITDQVIDRTHRRANTFFESAAVHVELADPFCPVLRDWLIQAGRGLEGVQVHERGTYVTMEGPAFSTRAESEMHRQWGADLIGMTAFPEARLAREAEIAYGHISLPTDYDCWRPHTPGTSPQALLAEIIGHLEEASTRSLRLIRAALEDVEPLRARRSPAHDALALAIWSERDRIPAEEVERLRPLWGRYFA